MKNGVNIYGRLARQVGAAAMRNFTSTVWSACKTFRVMAPLCWSDEEHWYKENRDTPCEIICVSCSKAFNQRHKDLLKIRHLILDNSMPGWRPNTSKYDGFTNYTHEPCTTVPLCTMFRFFPMQQPESLPLKKWFSFLEYRSRRSITMIQNGVDINTHFA
jgi:hypothetical protein